MPTPIRQCAGCRQREAITELVRLVWDDEHQRVVVDSTRRLPGRGVNVHPGCYERAVKIRAIGRGLRREIGAAALPAASVVTAERGERSPVG